MAKLRERRWVRAQPVTYAMNIILFNILSGLATPSPISRPKGGYRARLIPITLHILQKMIKTLVKK